MGRESGLELPWESHPKILGKAQAGLGLDREAIVHIAGDAALGPLDLKRNNSVAAKLVAHQRITGKIGQAARPRQVRLVLSIVPTVEHLERRLHEQVQDMRPDAAAVPGNTGLISNRRRSAWLVGFYFGSGFLELNAGLSPIAPLTGKSPVPAHYRVVESWPPCRPSWSRPLRRRCQRHGTTRIHRRRPDARHPRQARYRGYSVRPVRGSESGA